MPTHDAHQRPSAATTNPFEEQVRHVNEYTAKEIATLQSRLDKQLGPEYISSRQGAGGGKVHYLAAEKVINLANEVFGFNGWSSQIQNVQIDFVDENQQSGRITLGLSIIMRVTLKDGTFHEDIGYGCIENCKGKAAAFEKAKKEAATDSLKRALRNFGNVLGNCLYDKDYLARITKIKVQPSKWDAENLHRHADFAPTKKDTPAEAQDEREADSVPPLRHAYSAEMDEDFGDNLFDSVRPDEVALPPSRPETPRPQPPQRRQPQSHAQQNNHQPQHPRSSTLAQAPQRPAHVSIPPPTDAHLQHQQAPPQQQPPYQPQPPPPQPTSSNQAQQRPPNQALPQNQPARSSHSTPPEPAVAHAAQMQPPPRPHEPPVGFITGRAAEMLQGQGSVNPSVASALPRFNPNADSPSIRKTAGFDHTKSAPINRTTLGGAPGQDGVQAANQQQRAAPVNFVNPSENLQRRIGAPGGGMSPHSNRSAYKPPSMAAGMKRPYPPQLDGAAQVRPPLADVSNTAGQEHALGEEAKKQKIAETSITNE